MNTNIPIKQIMPWSRIALTGGLFYLLLNQLNFQTGLELLYHINFPFLIIAIGLHLLAFLGGSLRWWLLLQHINSQCNYRDIFPAYYLGLFSNNFLPTGFGGDVVRTAYLSVRGYQINQLLSSTIVDRLLGLLALLLTGLLTMLIQDYVPLNGDIIILICGITLFILLSTWLLFSSHLLNCLLRLQRNSRHNSRFLFLINLLKGFLAYRLAPKLLLNGMLLSLFLQLFVVGVYALLGYSLGLSLPLSIYFVIVPLVMLATNIPVSLGGLGLREGTLVALLLGVGVSYEQGVTLSLLYLLVLLLSTLPGGLILLKTHLPFIAFFYKIPNSLKGTWQNHSACTNVFSQFYIRNLGSGSR